MRHKFLVVVLTGLVIYSTMPIGRVMGISLIPRDDQSEYEISVTTPEGYSLERTSQITAELESRIWKLKGTEHVFTTIGQTQGGRVVKGEGDVTRGTIYVRITDLEKRNAAVPVRGWWDVAGQVRRFFDGRRIRPVRGPARGSQVSRRLSRPAGERQRRLAVPGGCPAPDLSGEPGGPRIEPARRLRRPAHRQAQEGRIDSSTSTRRSPCASPRYRS